MSSSLKLLIALIVAVAAFLAIRFAITSLPKQPDTPQENAASVNLSKLRGWREFKAPSGKFVALFPTLPQHVTDKVHDANGEIRKYETYVSADGVGPAFMLSTITLPNDDNKMQEDELLKSVVNDMLSRNKENKLQSMKTGKFRNLDAVDFALDNENVTISGKVFKEHNTLYVLSMINKDKLPHEEDLDFFINSFKINYENNLQNIKTK